MIQLSGSVLTTTLTVPGGIGSGNAFVQALKNTLVAAGWSIADFIPSEITFICGLTFTDPLSNLITIDSVDYTFWDPAVHGNEPNACPFVVISDGDSTGSKLAALAGCAQADPNIAEILVGKDLDTGQDQIKFIFVPSLTNGAFCNENNIIRVGQFDVSAPVGAYSHSGGWVLISQLINNKFATIKIVNSDYYNNTVIISVGSNNGPFVDFDGYVPGTSFQCTASAYYVWLYQTGAYGKNTTFFLGNMPTVGGLDYCIFGFGGVARNLGFGGARDNGFQSPIGHGIYYLKTPLDEYVRDNSSQFDPCFNFPCYAFGTNVVDRAGQQLAGKDLLKTDGNAVLYEPLVSVCLRNPDAVSNSPIVAFQFWDSLLCGRYSPMDTTGHLNGHPCITLLSDQGSGDIATGSFLQIT